MVPHVPSAARRPPGELGRAVAAVLRDELDSQKLTQAQLGRMVNLSQNQVSAYLRGVKGMTIDELDDLCRALGLSIVEVIVAASYEG